MAFIICFIAGAIFGAVCSKGDGDSCSGSGSVRLKAASPLNDSNPPPPWNS